MICRILPYMVDSGPANMALDEALLESVSKDPAAAVLRTYGWSVPTLSLGYFQRVAEARAEPRFAAAPMVRRPTGGGAIWHEHEITYAVVLPRSHPLGRRPTDLYRAVHGAIAAVLCAAGAAVSRRADATAAPAIRLDPEQPRNRPFLCFADNDPEDIVFLGVKLVGSAQRRKPGAILQHGSVLLARARTTPELPGFAELVGTAGAAADWVARLQESIPGALGLDPRADAPSRTERIRAAALEWDIYRDDMWTCKR